MFNSQVFCLNKLFKFIVIPFFVFNAQNVNAQLYPQEPSAYPFLNTNMNWIQFYSRSAIDKFANHWKQTQTQKMSIVHMGDSHLQADILPEQIRKKLQAIHGDGGRGMVFPFSTVKTYSSFFYLTSHTGVWDWHKAITIIPKLPMGAIGMTCRTYQPNATFTLNFLEDIPKDHNVIKFFVKKTNKSFDFVIENGTNKIPVVVDSSNADIPFIKVKVPPLSRKITIRTVKSNPEKKEFEFSGMSIEKEEDKGVIFHNVGVGAARYQSILYQKLFVKHLPGLEPDVCLIDFGTNDYLYDDLIKPELESEIKKVIEICREANPEMAIILTTTQDLYLYGRNRYSGEKFSDLIQKIAKDTECAFYDWYWVSGGRTALKKWVYKGLAQPDYIHLTISGYRLKGNLIAEAMKNTMEWLDQNPDSTSLILPLDSLKASQKWNAVKSTQNTQITVGKNAKYHVISYGETLGGIALKYKVTVSQIMTWNGLKTSRIVAGRKLLIYTKD